MKIELPLLILFTLCSLSFTDDCSDRFNMENICNSFINDQTSKCIYSEGKCVPGYSECGEYAPDSNFDDKTCTSIIPSDTKTECVPEGEGNNRRCVPKKLKCEKFKKLSDCKDLAVDDEETQRCVVVDGTKCETHYKNCEVVTNSGICSKNIPSDNSKKCIWSSNSCTEDDRTCDAFINFYDKDGSYKACHELKKDDKQVCFLEGGKCLSYYKKCDFGTKTNCATIKPFDQSKIDANGNGYGINSFNPKAYCAWEKKDGESEESCHEENYECNQVKGEENKGVCQLIDATNTKKKCTYDETNKKCTEIYPTCQSYNDDSSVKTKDSATCRNIKIANGDHYTCTLEEDSCVEKKKECKDITDKTICNSHVFENSDGDTKQNKKCTFLANNTCVETYKKCSDYQDDATIADKLKSICEIIPPFTDIDGYFYNCTFDSQDGCQRNKIECEYYKGDSTTCNLITRNFDDIKYQCKSNNGKCIKQYKTCDEFNSGNPANDDIEQNKENCLSIILPDSNKKCYLEHDKTCKETDKLCSEYLGSNEGTCENYYRASSNDKHCAFVNNKCTEVDNIVEEYYDYCSDYQGTDKKICESIIPHTETSFYNDKQRTIDYSFKCEYDTNIGCVRKHKECSEAKSEYECRYISPEDINQQCVYINNNCVQQYKSCSLYETEVKTEMTKNGCESIRIKDGIYNFINSYCEYEDNSGTKSCTRKDRKCEDITSELIQKIAPSTCTSLSTSESKRCVYNSNKCIEQAKTCKELFYFSTSPSPTNNICENAPTSSNEKVCKMNHNSNGCEERDPKSASSNSGTNSGTNPGTNSSNNDGRRIYTSSKIIFALILFIF